MALSGILFLSQTKIVLLCNHIGGVTGTNTGTYTRTLTDHVYTYAIPIFVFYCVETR